MGSPGAVMVNVNMLAFWGTGLKLKLLYAE